MAKEHERADISSERREWEDWQKNCSPEKIICLDESSVKTNFTSLRGWGEKGKRIEGAAPGSWQTYTVLSYLTYDGKTDGLIFKGGVDKHTFKKFMEEILLPNTRRGDVVIMDNLRVHKKSFNQKLFENKGVEIRYIPRYSPEYNPIEMMWSKIKTILRKNKPRDFLSIWRVMSMAHMEVKQEDAQGWYKEAGYSH